MQYTINQFRKEAFKEVYQVYEVFQNFFGEDNVDLQDLPDDDTIAAKFSERNIPMREDGSSYEGHGNTFNSVIRDFSTITPFILVYWPRVKVTNENNKSIYIQDLYAKIKLDANGYMPVEDTGFRLNRATYPIEQWECSYLHSHINHIPKGNLTNFQVPCLGTGPIRDTICNLKAGISEGFDETKWMLFCHELSLYVTVESITGVPYNYLEKVHLNRLLPEYGNYDENYDSALYRFRQVFSLRDLRDFILYYLHNGNMAINYQDGIFKIGMSYFDYMIDISNSFIEYFNSNFEDRELAQKCFSPFHILQRSIASNGQFFDPSSSATSSDIRDYIGKKVCTFKGRDITLNITGESEEKPQETIILSHGLAMYILNNILRTINFHYTNEYTKQHCQGSTTTLPATIGQRIQYI